MSRRAIVLSFDLLNLGFLGCYGSEWVETPHFDRLASRSTVFDNHFAEDVTPGAAGHAWWTGYYQFPRSAEQQQSQTPFTTRLHAAGIGTRLIAEEHAAGVTGDPPPFDMVETVTGSEGLNAKPARTPFARLVRRGLERLSELSAPGKDGLLWLKSAGVPVPWLPPHELAAAYLEDDELSERQDDESDWRVSQAMYAGYVSLLDHWLGELLEGIERHFKDDPPLLIVTAAQGSLVHDLEPLLDQLRRSARKLEAGEATPFSARELQNEIVHTPFFVSLPGGDAAGTRRDELVQTVDLAPTLLEWFGLKTEAADCEGKSLLPLLQGEGPWQREYACMGEGDRLYGIRTADYHCVAELLVDNSQSAEEEGQAERVQLYIKPDDFWEVNDISGQAPDIAASLTATLREFVRRAGEP